MFHYSGLALRLARRDTSVPLLRKRVPWLLCRTGSCSVHAGARFRPVWQRLCSVNVKLTMRLAIEAELALLSARIPVRAGCLQGPATGVHRWRQTVWSLRGEGWGYPIPQGRKRSARPGEGVLSTLSFSVCLCTCAKRAKPPIWADRSPALPCFRSSTPWNPDLNLQQVPPDMPREPILTLPAALTAYVVLLAVIHLRVLLPPELGELDRRRLRLHSASATIRRCSTSIFPAAPAQRSGPSSPIRCCTPISAISSSTCCGCCRSAARWRGGSARSGSSCSWR